MKSLGNFLKEKRKQAGLTQLAFAERAGVALTVIRKIEQGKGNLQFRKSKSCAFHVWSYPCSRSQQRH